MITKSIWSVLYCRKYFDPMPNLVQYQIIYLSIILSQKILLQHWLQYFQVLFQSMPF